MGLLVRFFDPTHGAVRFDGHDIRELKLERHLRQGLARHAGAVPVFAPPSQDNIRFGRPDATTAEVQEAARAAYIHEDIMALPGRTTKPRSGIGGRDLSGGQRQRLTVARALLKNAPILLLDEATSALDSVAEKEVQRAIDKLMIGRTTFVIAHRLSTLRKADRVLVLDAGRCVGLDRHEALLRNCAVYKTLWEAQFLSEDGAAPERPAAVHRRFQPRPRRRSGKRGLAGVVERATRRHLELHRAHQIAGIDGDRPRVREGVVREPAIGQPSGGQRRIIHPVDVIAEHRLGRANPAQGDAAV